MTTHRAAPLAFIYDRYASTSTAIVDIRLAACRAYATAQGWEHAGEYVDVGDDALSDHRRPMFDVMCEVMAEAAHTGPVLCLLDDWDRITRDANQSAVMRRRVALAGGHCATTGGETDQPSVSRGRLTIPAVPT